MSAVIELVRSPAALRRLHELLVEYERDLPPDMRHGHEPALQEVESRYRGENAGFLARIGKEYVGCAAVTTAGHATAILQRLYVQPVHRGHGAARAPAQAAIAFARELGCRRIVLDTDRERLNAAYALYLSLGFTECEPYGAADYASPTYMELALA